MIQASIVRIIIEVIEYKWIYPFTRRVYSLSGQTLVLWAPFRVSVRHTKAELRCTRLQDYAQKLVCVAVSLEEYIAKVYNLQAAG